MSFIGRKQMLWVVERGCRFGEIDAVFRNVRLFLFGIPFKSHYPLGTGTIWDNINIKQQYNFAGCSLLVTHHSSLLIPFQRPSPMEPRGCERHRWANPSGRMELWEKRDRR